MQSSANPVLFHWLRWRVLCNSLHVVLRQSLARVLTVLLCSGLIWGTLFGLSYVGFHELQGRWNFSLDGNLILTALAGKYRVVTIPQLLKT